MAIGGGNVTFLNLAYLIEISVVLNLAYRELKFAELHKRLITTINKVKKEKKDLGDKIQNFPEYISLTKLAEEKEGGDGVKKIWQHTPFIRFFFYNLIVSRKSLSIVNWSILVNVFTLLIFTFFSDLQVSVTKSASYGIGLGIAVTSIIIIVLGIINWGKYIINVVVASFLVFIYIPVFISCIPILNENIYFDESTLWGVAFGVLIMLTITPLALIKMTTLCEVFLLGEDGDGCGGVVKQLLDEIDERNDGEKKEIDNIALQFSIDGDNKF